MLDVAELLLVLSRKRMTGRLQVRTNTAAAVLHLDGGRLTATLSIATDGERIFAVYAVVNPDKLGRHPSS